MYFFYATILGLVEGITEFLPISSTGHLILAQNILGLPATEFWKSFEIAIQLGAILAVVVLYWKKIWDVKNVWPKLLVAFLPTAVIGLALYKIIKMYLLGNSAVVLAAMFVGGVVIILFEKYYSKLHGESSIPPSLQKGGGEGEVSHGGSVIVAPDPTPALPFLQREGNATTFEQITYRQAFFVGLFQSIAIIPGVSRSAATIIGGLALGLSRPLIIEFSFLLAVPTMAAATGLDLLKSGLNFSANEWGIMAIGFVVSFLTALVAIKWLLRYITKHNFSIFGYYRVTIVMLLLFIVLFF